MSHFCFPKFFQIVCVCSSKIMRGELFEIRLHELFPVWCVARKTISSLIRNWNIMEYVRISFPNWREQNDSAQSHIHFVFCVLVFVTFLQSLTNQHFQQQTKKQSLKHQYFWTLRFFLPAWTSTQITIN